MNELFPETFMRAIEGLALDAAPVRGASSTGAHLSRAVGASLDFRDYRPYAAGDDLRRVDWNVYSRSGHFFLRRFEQPTATPVHLLIDNSPSMFVESPTRYAAAARVAVAVAAAALRNGDPLSLHWVDEGSADAAASLRAVVGRRRLPDVTHALASVGPSKTASLARGVDALVDSRGRSGVAVVVSDLFDPDGIDSLCRTLDRIPHRLVLIGVRQPWDAEPALETDSEFVDCENGRSAVVAATPAALAAYLQAYAAYQARLLDFVTQRGVVYATVDASAEPIHELARLFPNGVLRVGGPTR